MENQIYHIVYLTRNLINNKIYIGKHSTYDLNDGYLGSGKLLKLAFTKYGKENFERLILHICLTETEAFHWEAFIVDEDFIKLPNVYNATIGGLGTSGRLNKGKTFQEIHGDNSKQALINISLAQTGRVKLKYELDILSKTHKGKNLTPEHIQILSDKSKGNKNPNFEGKITKQTDIRNKISKTKKDTGVHAFERNSHAKTYVFITPLNEVIMVEGKSKHFCKEHGLSYQFLFNHMNTKIIKENFNKKVWHKIKSYVGWEYRSLEYHNSLK